MSRPIVLTLAIDERDNATDVTKTMTWSEFTAITHHRREDKFSAPGRHAGFSPARFKAGRCTCGKPPQRAHGALPAKRGCPDHPLNFAGRPRGHRIVANVEAVTLIGIDLDKNPDGTELTAANARLYVERLRAAGIAAVIWSSHSYGAPIAPATSALAPWPVAPIVPDGGGRLAPWIGATGTSAPWPAPTTKSNLRVFLLPSRDMTPLEYRRIYGPVLDALEIPSGIGRSPDPRRYWLMPSARPGAPVVHEVIQGPALDVDYALTLAPAIDVAPVTSLVGPLIDVEMPDDKAQQDAIDALADAWPAPGTRHETRGELAGALAWSGWDEADIVRFLDGVTAQTNGGKVSATVHAANCRWASGSVNKVGSDKVKGWASLARRLGDAPVDKVRRILDVSTLPEPEQFYEIDEWLIGIGQAAAAEERRVAAVRATQDTAALDRTELPEQVRMVVTHRPFLERLVDDMRGAV